jgi:hypothetical protein
MTSRDTNNSADDEFGFVYNEPLRKNKKMTSKKNMTANRKPRRIHRNKGGRKKGSPLEQLKKITKENTDWFKWYRLRP